MSNGRIAAAIACAAFLAPFFGSAAHAIDAYWHGVRSNVWEDGIAGQRSNWYSEAPPNGVARNVPDHTARFAEGAMRTSVVIRQDSTIARMLFEATAPRYSFLVTRNREFTINGIGIANQSNQPPNLRVLGFNGAIYLRGLAQIAGVSAPAARITTVDGAYLMFLDSSRGGTALVFNTANGVTDFRGTSSAEQMTITNRTGGSVEFSNKSTGDQAHILNEANGRFICQKTNPFTLAIGRLDNDGQATLNRCTVQVARSYTQGASGKLRLWISDAVRFGSVVTGQSATVGGALEVHIDPTVPVPRTFKIVRAGGRRNGTFASLTFTGRNDVRGRLAYSAKEVSLIVEKK